MLRSSTLIVLFSVVTAFLTVHCEFASWVDPTDLHSYDHASIARSPGRHAEYHDYDVDPADPHGFNGPRGHTHKKDKQPKATAQNGNDKVVDTQETEANSSCTEDKFKSLTLELNDCKLKCSHGSQKNLVSSLLQRQASMILNAANLVTQPAEGYAYHERYMIVALDNEALQKLQEFAATGEIDLLTLDSIWSSMLLQAENPNVLRWYDISYWKPEISISRETFCMYAAIGAVLATVTMLAMGVSLWRIILIILVMAFAFSVTMKAFRVHQANTARLHHLRSEEGIEKMPSACRPHKRNWLEYFKHFNTEEYDKETCAKYYTDGYTDPMTQIDLFELIVIQFSETTVTTSASLGKAFSVFFKHSFDDMPGFLAPIVQTIAKLLGLVIAAVAVVLGFMWLTPTVLRESVKSTYHALRSPDQPQIANNITQPTTQPIIVNVNLPSGAIISNEVTPPRRLSEPAFPSVEAGSSANPKKLNRLLSEPIIKKIEPMPTIEDSPATSTLEVSDQIEKVEVDLERFENNKNKDDINITPPIFTLDDPDLSDQDAEVNQEPLNLEFGEPESPLREPVSTNIEVKSPLLTELQRLLDDETEEGPEE